MFPEVETLIGGVNDDGVFQEGIFFQIVQKTSHIFIHCFDGAQVVLHIALVFPPHLIFIGHRRILFLKILIDLGVSLREIFPLRRSEAGHFPFESDFVRTDLLDSQFVHYLRKYLVVPGPTHVLEDVHLCLSGRRPPFVFIKQGSRLWEGLVGKFLHVTLGHQPRTVRRLVQVHQQEWLLLFPVVFQPV